MAIKKLPQQNKSKNPNPVRVVRQKKREIVDSPELVSAEFKLLNDQKNYKLNVMDYSNHGIGLIITKINFDLIDRIKPGDIIQNISFYASWALIKVDGIVRHISRISEGKYKGYYLLGLKSNDALV